MNIERIRHCYSILAGVPTELFIHDLEEYVDEPGKPLCGTHACGAGWYAMHPDSPIKVDHDGNIDCSAIGGDLFGNGPNKIECLLFGTCEGVFQIRGECNFDHEWDDLSDKELMLYRLRRLLGQTEEDSTWYGAITDAADGDKAYRSMQK